MAHPQIVDAEDDVQIRNVAANILNGQWWTADKGWSCSFGLDETLTSHLNNAQCDKTFHKTSHLDYRLLVGRLEGHTQLSKTWS